MSDKNDVIDEQGGPENNGPIPEKIQGVDTDSESASFKSNVPETPASSDQDVPETPASSNDVSSDQDVPETPASSNDVSSDQGVPETPASSDQAVSETPASSVVDDKRKIFFVKIDLTDTTNPIVNMKENNDMEPISENGWKPLELPQPSQPKSSFISNISSKIPTNFLKKKTPGGRVTKKRKNAIRKTVHRKNPRNSTSKKHTSTKKRQPMVR
jgi:hypothetical protein